MYIDHLFQPFEDAICFRLILTITSHGASSSQKQEISLPCHLGGLGPKDNCQYAASIMITSFLSSLIADQSVQALLRFLEVQVHQDHSSTPKVRASKFDPIFLHNPRELYT